MRSCAVALAPVISDEERSLLYQGSNFCPLDSFSSCGVCNGITAESSLVCFGCSSFATKRIEEQLLRDIQAIQACGTSYVCCEIPDFLGILATVPKVAAGLCYDPKACTELVLVRVSELLERSINHLQSNVYIEITERFGDHIGRFFQPSSLLNCPTHFSQLVYHNKKLARSLSSQLELASLVESALHSLPLRDLDELVEAEHIAWLGDPRLHKQRRSTLEPPAKRVRLSLGAADIKGREITPDLWRVNQSACHSLISNLHFKCKYPLEWRALWSLQS